jgi:hypothetical protein
MRTHLFRSTHKIDDKDVKSVFCVGERRLGSRDLATTRIEELIRL